MCLVHITNIFKMFSYLQPNITIKNISVIIIMFKTNSKYLCMDAVCGCRHLQDIKETTE